LQYIVFEGEYLRLTTSQPPHSYKLVYAPVELMAAASKKKFEFGMFISSRTWMLIQQTPTGGESNWNSLIQ